jgi:hypothetical protein
MKTTYPDEYYAAWEALYAEHLKRVNDMGNALDVKYIEDEAYFSDACTKERREALEELGSRLSTESSLLSAKYAQYQTTETDENNLSDEISQPEDLSGSDV